METKGVPRVVMVDRVDGGVYIEFEDGKSGLYSAELLYSTLAQAAKMNGSGLDAE